MHKSYSKDELNNDVPSRRQKIKSLLPNFFDYMRFYEGKIIAYDPEYLFSYGFINPRASVLSWGMMFRCLVMCGVGTFVSQFRCPATQTHYQFCFPIMVSAEGLIFASLVSFLLGMFTSSTFTRWWSCREKLTTQMNNVMMLTILLSSFCDSSEARVHAIIERIKRWAHLSHALVHKQADNNFELKDLVASGICTPAEAEQIVKSAKTNMPSLVFSWNMEEIRHLLLTNKVASEVEPALLGCVTGSNQAMMELQGLLKTQMPYSYLHLLTLITKIHLAFICFYAGGIIAQGITGYAWTRILFGYVVIIANNIIYEGLLFIHSMLVNPCGDDAGDFPTSLFWRNIYDTCNSVLSLPLPESKHEPEEIEEMQVEERLEKHLDGTITMEVS